MGLPELPPYTIVLSLLPFFNTCGAHISFRLPTVEQGLRSMTAWELQTHIPGIVGAVDGTHIQIRPSKDGEGYFNRKGFYSLNVQGIFLLVATVL